jgi:hypothetical protein
MTPNIWMARTFPSQFLDFDIGRKMRDTFLIRFITSPLPRHCECSRKRLRLANISTKEALKQLLILERTPEPDTLSPEPSFLQALDPEQRREAERYIEQLRSSQTGSGAAIKRERDENGNEIAGPSKKKARKSGDKIMIDLTNDSNDDQVSQAVGD